MSTKWDRNKKLAPLKRGDTVALIAPAGRVERAKFFDAVKRLQRFGFCTVIHPKRQKAESFRHPVFAGEDELRAEELAWSLSEPGIQAVFCVRGGYGSQRTWTTLMSKPSWKKRHIDPRWVLGFSDITYLLHAISNRWHFPTFHSLMLGSLSDQKSKVFLNSLVNFPREFSTQVWQEVKLLRSGSSGRAQLAGGNLSLLQVVGPAALPRDTPLILFLEDINENLYRLDRRLQELSDANLNIRGLILGHFQDCGKDDAKRFRWERIHETLKKICPKGPIWLNAKFGHGLKAQRILPIGISAQMKGRTLELSSGWLDV